MSVLVLLRSVSSSCRRSKSASRHSSAETLRSWLMRPSLTLCRATMRWVFIICSNYPNHSDFLSVFIHKYMQFYLNIDLWILNVNFWSLSINMKSAQPLCHFWSLDYLLTELSPSCGSSSHLNWICPSKKTNNGVKSIQTSVEVTGLVSDKWCRACTALRSLRRC